MKQLIRLTENDLHNIVRRVIKEAIEGSVRYDKWYRGYNSKYGSDSTHLLWLTDDIDYARCYGNRVEEVMLDVSKLHCRSVYGIDELLGYEFDYYIGPDADEVSELLDGGCNGYYFTANNGDSDCLCLFDKSVIVSRRELSEEEFNNIEGYDGYELNSY